MTGLVAESDTHLFEYNLVQVVKIPRTVYLPRSPYFISRAEPEL